MMTCAASSGPGRKRPGPRPARAAPPLAQLARVFHVLVGLYGPDSRPLPPDAVARLVAAGVEHACAHARTGAAPSLGVFLHAPTPAAAERRAVQACRTALSGWRIVHVRATDPAVLLGHLGP